MSRLLSHQRPLYLAYLVDSIALTSGPLQYNRLINLVAEDNAIEDTIYHLHRALNAGRIDLERFLRVRHLWHLALFRLCDRSLYLITAHTDHAHTCRRAVHEEGVNREDSSRHTHGRFWFANARRLVIASLPNSIQLKYTDRSARIEGTGAILSSREVVSRPMSRAHMLR